MYYRYIYIRQKTSKDDNWGIPCFGIKQFLNYWMININIFIKMCNGQKWLQTVLMQRKYYEWKDKTKFRLDKNI